MGESRNITTKVEYDQAVARLWEVFDAEPGTLEEAEGDVLAELVADYDARHYPIPCPSPTDLIQGRLDALGLSEADLIPGMGSQEKVDEVLSGKMTITPEIALGLHKLLGIAVADLLADKAVAE